jgi:putative FmdB family regulatory protein
VPTYSYRCVNGCTFDAVFAMAEVPAELTCTRCGVSARRVIGAPHLAATGTPAFQAVDAAARSAHEPSVVTSLPSKGRQRVQRVTHNPLHQKLPRQ